MLIAFFSATLAIKIKQNVFESLRRINQNLSVQSLILITNKADYLSCLFSPKDGCYEDLNTVQKQKSLIEKRSDYDLLLKSHPTNFKSRETTTKIFSFIL